MILNHSLTLSTILFLPPPTHSGQQPTVMLIILYLIFYNNNNNSATITSTITCIYLHYLWYSDVEEEQPILVTGSSVALGIQALYEHFTEASTNEKRSQSERTTFASLASHLSSTNFVKSLALMYDLLQELSVLSQNFRQTQLTFRLLILN